jgi:predicted small secreted protein
MKKRVAGRAVIFWLAVVFVAGLLAGCETCKGLNRDIKQADAWIKDNMW